MNDIAKSNLRFSFDEGIVSVHQRMINCFYVFVWLGARTHVNGSLKGVFPICGNDLLHVGNAHDFLPVSGHLLLSADSEWYSPESR